jgi:hypothetical protein
VLEAWEVAKIRHTVRHYLSPPPWRWGGMTLGPGVETGWRERGGLKESEIGEQPLSSIVRATSSLADAPSSGAAMTVAGSGLHCGGVGTLALPHRQGVKAADRYGMRPNSSLLSARRQSVGISAGV